MFMSVSNVPPPTNPCGTRRKRLSGLEVSCIVPLKRDGDLVDVVLIGRKMKGSEYTFDDISFLESAQSIAAIAVKMPIYMNRQSARATVDHLTGLLNRKSFMERLNEVYNDKRNDSVALIILIWMTSNCLTSFTAPMPEIMR